MPTASDNSPASRLTPHASRVPFLLLLFFLLTACAVFPVTRPVVKIGLVAPFEGPYRYVGYDAIYAARLALREANGAGGVARRAGYTVELVAYDDRGTVQGARAAAQSLLVDPQVIAVIGHFRDETTRAARSLYAWADVPLVDAGAVRGELGDWLCPLLAYLKKTSDPQVAWMGPAEAWPSCAQDVLHFASVTPPPGVDVLVLNGDPVAVAEGLLFQRRLGWDGPVAGGPALGSPLFLQVAGEEAGGLLFASSLRWPEPQGRDAAFDAAYRAVGPHVPPPGPFALSTYQATQRLLAAIVSAAERGQPPTRRTLAPYLEPPPEGEIYLYRWGPSGALERVVPAP